MASLLSVEFHQSISPGLLGFPSLNRPFSRMELTVQVIMIAEWTLKETAIFANANKYFKEAFRSLHHFTFDGMNMAMERSERHPSFYRKLLGDFTRKLEIPPAFLKNFQGKVPKKLLVKCSRRSWFITTEESDEGYHFSQGLAKFVNDLHLEVGDLLIFSMVGRETFEVVAYDTNRCEKKIISTRSSGRQPCTYAECERGRFDEVKKEGEESIMGVECYMPARHPYFVRSIRKYEMHWLNLPAAFAREAGLKSKRSIVIEDPQRRMWPVRLRQYVKHTSISGWSSVVKANGFAIGDTLMFEYLRGSGNAIALRIMSRAGRNGAGPAYEKRA